MSRRLDHTMAFDAPAEAIYGAYANPAYWQALATKYDEITPGKSEITSFSCTGDGIEVTIRQVLPRAELPSLLRAIIPLDMAVTRVQHLDPYDRARGAADGGYTASVPHAPGHLDGHYALRETRTGSLLQSASTCRVSVPLVSGKLEDLILHGVKEVFIVEEAFTADWIAKHP